MGSPLSEAVPVLLYPVEDIRFFLYQSGAPVRLPQEFFLQEVQGRSRLSALGDIDWENEVQKYLFFQKSACLAGNIGKFSGIYVIFFQIKDREFCSISGRYREISCVELQKTGMLLLCKL